MCILHGFPVDQMHCNKYVETRIIFNYAKQTLNVYLIIECMQTSLNDNKLLSFLFKSKCRCEFYMVFLSIKCTSINMLKLRSTLIMQSRP